MPISLLRFGIFVVSLTACAGAWAQFPTSAEMPAVDYMPILFLNPKVSADMGLTPAQIQQEQTMIMKEGMSMLGMMGNGGAGLKGTEGMKKMLSAFSKMEKASLTPLSAKQRIRYHQLTLQMIGPSELLLPNVAHQLKITPAQSGKLASLANAQSQSMKALSKAQGGDPMAAMHQLRAAQAAARAKQEKMAHQILTPSQWAKWTAMQGKKLPGIEDPFGGLGG